VRVEDYPAQEPLTERGVEYTERYLAKSAAVGGHEAFYGDHPCQSLLVCPSERPDGRVLAFMYGGGWTNGYKELMAFMAPAFNAAGVTFVSIGYRLAPEFVFPEGWLDSARAVGWIHDNIARLGGDPTKLFVGGWSAGGHYASLLATRRDWQGAQGVPRDVIRGCVTMTGIFDFTPGNGMSVRPRFLGPVEAAYDVPASPLFNLDAPAPPFLLTFGSDDFPHLALQSRKFAAVAAAKGVDVELHEIAGRSHFTLPDAGGEADGPWVPLVLDWMDRHSKAYASRARVGQR